MQQAMAPPARYEDAGKNLQRQMMAREYDALAHAKENRTPVAYLFISGNIQELFRSFGFLVAYPEINALQCGIKKAAGPLILQAEDKGYSSDVCGYVKNDIGLVMQSNKSPMGNLPRPDLLVCNFSGCNTYIKWFEALSEFYDVPLVMLDVPYVRDGLVPKEDMEYTVSQLNDVIATCEKVTGRAFDKQGLSDILALSAKAEDKWCQVLETATRVPSPIDSFFEAVFFMAGINIFRGTQECVDYYDAVLAEIGERVERGLGPVEEERFRVVMEGPPPWPHFRAFWELFKRWGVVCTAATYPKVGGLFDTGLRHDPSRPVESLATYAMNCYTNWSLDKRAKLMEDYVRHFRADALVIHSVKSCRSFSVGQGDFRDLFVRGLNIPTLLVESDLADPRYFQEAQLRNRIDAFFEALDHRKLVAAGGAR
ncbi:MAG TPA: 2-hydroxyacyl-CoA dehydratase family protein [Candidatus Thermoplasmatota archaeon]